MCGIFFLNFKTKNGFDFKLNPIFNILSKRGPDSQNYFKCNLNNLNISSSLSTNKLKKNTKISLNKDDILFCHSLMSFDGFLPMPIIDEEGIFVSNHEIYEYPRDMFHNDSVFLKDKIKHFKEKYNWKEISGMYASIYYDYKKNKLTSLVDPFSIKSLYYYNDDNLFLIASEKKMLYNVLIQFYNYKNSIKSFLEFENNFVKLNGNQILEYDFNERKLDILNKDFIITDSIDNSKFNEVLKINNVDDINNIDDKILKKSIDKFQDALIKTMKNKKRKEKVGILFSGGIDSVIIAYGLKDLIDKKKIEKSKVKLYGSVLKDNLLSEPKDLFYQKEFAKRYNIKMSIKEIDLKNLEKDLVKIIKIIEDNHPIKLSVAIAFYYSLKQAKKEGVRLCLSGLGSEEIFAGYNRHLEILKSLDFNKFEEDRLNQECINGLNDLSNRDLYRDDLVSMNFSVEIRFPFLEQNFVDYIMSLPSYYKINYNVKKILLRKMAKEIGVDKIFYARKKVAAQYGSNYDKALRRVARKNKFHTRKEYLEFISKNEFLF